MHFTCILLPKSHKNSMRYILLTSLIDQGRHWFIKGIQVRSLELRFNLKEFSSRVRSVNYYPMEPPICVLNISANISKQLLQMARILWSWPPCNAVPSLPAQHWLFSLNFVWRKAGAGGGAWKGYERLCIHSEYFACLEVSISTWAKGRTERLISWKLTGGRWLLLYNKDPIRNWVIYHLVLLKGVSPLHRGWEDHKNLPAVFICCQLLYASILGVLVPRLKI